MKIFRLSDAQTAELGFTHRFEITYVDVAAISGTTSGTIALAAYLAGQGVLNAATKLVTPFDGGATSELTFKAGWNGATTDDDDGIIEARSLHADATYITYGDGTGAAFATKRTGYFPLDAGNWEALFTSTGANLSAITSGEVHLYLRLSDIRNG